MTTRLLVILLALKLLVLVTNTLSYESHRQYDALHHAWRARSAGFELGKMAYNAPVYTAPLLPWVDLGRFYEGGRPILDVPNPKHERERNFQLLDKLRHLNVVYVFGAYVVWIFGLLPRLLSSRSSHFLASSLLLALPGYQKVAVMAHPDVLLIFLSSLAFLLALRAMNERPTLARQLPIAVVAGLMAACRPFAIVPLAAIWLLSMRSILGASLPSLRDGARDRWRQLSKALGKAMLFSAIAGMLASGWWVFRYHHTGHFLNVYKDSYIEKFEPLRANFDYAHYYTSFYFLELLETPSREKVGNAPSLAPLGNTFFTQLYSEFWGDHYLYVSAAKNRKDDKVQTKRALFVLALPLSVWMVCALLWQSIKTITQAARLREFFSPRILATAIWWGSFALFLYWQATSGLLPGKNSTIKFLYIAWMVPFGIATLLQGPTSSRRFWLVLTCIVFVTIAAFPMSLVGS